MDERGQPLLTKSEPHTITAIAMNQIDTQTVNVLEIIGCALIDFMAWEEVGKLACNAIPEGFVIYLN